MQLLQSASVADPHHFVTPARLDIAVKVRLFSDIADKMSNHPEWLRVEQKYIDHIKQRTGGNEKRSWKSSIDDYVDAAESLYRSMARRGFDRQQPVELGSNLNLRGGAHRIACALVLDEPVHVRVVDKPGNAAVWDEAFLRAHGMSEKNITIILKRYARLEDAARLRVG